jgi:hypothetical protein
MAGLPSPRFRFGIDRGDHGAEELIQSRGLRLAHHFWHMQIDLAGPVEAGAAPAEAAGAASRRARSERRSPRWRARSR